MIEETLPGVRQHDDKRMVADGYVLEDNGIQAYLPADYTASIDAALTLVLEGSAWAVSHGDPDPEGYPRPYRATVMPGTDGRRDATDHHTVPAIALCIAALKASAAKPAYGEDQKQ